MCRVYKCFEMERFEDADEAGHDALDSMRTCSPALAGFYLSFIEQTAPHLMTEIPIDVIFNVQYQEHLDHRAKVSVAHNKFRQGMAMEVCPI